MSTVISLDCEANGLHGEIFAAAAAIYVDGVETEQWQQRCPIYSQVDEWVEHNVLPALTDMDITLANAGDVVASWYDLYARLKGPDTLVIAHVAWPIETRFLWNAHAQTPFSGPFPLIDVASMLHALNFDPLSVDGYLRREQIALPDGSPHHPLYDCRAAALVYFDLARQL